MQLPTPERLRQKRLDLTLTQSEIAKRAGVSQPLIARIESGDVDPRLSTLRKIFTAFEEVEKEKVLARDIMHTLVIFVSSDDSVESAVHLMEENGFSQVPVIDQGVPLGSISEDTIIKVMTERKASDISQMRIKDIMGDAFPTVSPTTELNEISHLLERNPAVLVIEKGVTTGFVTKHDVIKLLHG
ncbi:MAG: CBS domain-containing protein [Methanococcoides sp.]|nr:CBS domain-containing protein [Methanococcoides sp.]